MASSFILFAIAFAGLIAGYVLAKLTPEELKAGEKWFKLICLACLSALIVLSIIYKQYYALIIAFAVMIFYSLREKTRVRLASSAIIYLLLALTLWLSLDSQLALISSSLIFIFLISFVSLRKGKII